MKYDVVLYNSTKQFGYRIGEHLGLAYISASLRKVGYKVKIVDSLLECISPKEAVDSISKLDFKIIGVSFLSYSWLETKQFIEGIRKIKSDIVIVVGGHFASFNYKELLRDIPEIDYVSVGEGEESFRLLVDAILNKNDVNDIPGLYSRSIFNSTVKPISDLDSLPFPSRDYLPFVLKNSGIAALNTSRGCYGVCTFCSVQNFYNRFADKKWRGRSVYNIIEEIQYLMKDYQATYFDFQDDNFMGPGFKGKERANKLALEIIKKKIKARFKFDLRVNDIDYDTLKLWKEAGLTYVLIGIESIVERDLSFYNKKITTTQIKNSIKILEDLGISYRLGTLFFNPYTLVEDVHDNLGFLNEINYYDPNMLSILNVYNGTKACDILREDGILEGCYYNYTWKFVNHNTEKFFDICKKNIKKSLIVRRYLNEHYHNFKYDGVFDRINQNFVYKLSSKFIKNEKYDSILLEFDERLNNVLKQFEE
ncbi:B12-binding domain-containing radical SAM protein [Clostridium neuense]|uniref:B12-binding domain-containing radical SAM protein n=1 Tax=Clostridium neuense TaxID=1728934 RepID=A0ABW8TDH6_9CLOT